MTDYDDEAQIEITYDEETVDDMIAKTKDKEHEDTVNDILTDLNDWRSEFSGEQLVGFDAAIQVIKSNYPSYMR